MSEEILVRVHIQEDQNYKQKDQTLRFNMDEQETVQTLIQELVNQNKLVIPLDKVFVDICGKEASLKLHIGDCVDNNSVKVIIRSKQQSQAPVETSEKKLMLLISIQDGDERRGFNFPVNPLCTWNDIKKDIDSHIINNKLMDNWTFQEEVYVFKGASKFKKINDAFQKMGVPQNTEFKMVRMYPGGGM